MKILVIITILAVFAVMPASLMAQRDETRDAITGTDPLAGYETGMGQAVQPIIKSPVGGAGSQPVPTVGAPSQPTPNVEPARQQLKPGQYYPGTTQQDGRYYPGGVRTDGKYEVPDITPKGKTTTPATITPSTPQPTETPPITTQPTE